MTLEIFFNSTDLLVIHCSTGEQSMTLLKAFDNYGKKWNSGRKYNHITNWENYKDKTCYTNSGQYYFLDYYKEKEVKIIPFSEVIL